MIIRKHARTGLVALAGLALLAACSPPAQEAKTDAAPPAAETNAVADTAANAVAGNATDAAAAPAGNATDAAAAPAGNATAAAAAPAGNATAAAAAPAAVTAGLMELDITDASGAKLSGDPSKGEAVFRQCQTCHVLAPGQNKVGPSLAGIFGRTSGSVPGFRYSEANKASGIVWNAQEMFVYLENPRARIPGTNMAFVGIKDAQKRADLIAYIKANGGVSGG